MSRAFEDITRLLPDLTSGEKAQLLQTVANDVGGAFPGIESTPGVCGGEPCIVRTRIPVRVLEQYRRLGLSEAALLQNFPTLRAQDLANAWAYVQARRGEIDDLIRADAEDA
jgi:uncharacterized protein (DUF433 family)